MKSRVIGLLLCSALLCGSLSAQTDDSSVVERTYPFSVDAVQKALQHIGGFGGGKLPVLDGFVTATDSRPLRSSILPVPRPSQACGREQHSRQRRGEDQRVC